MLDTILFDLDGTLLPMHQDDFVKAYIQKLCHRYVPYGFDKNQITAAMWEGTRAMVQNDGTCSNADRFWACFDEKLGDTTAFRKTIPSFYLEDFDEIRSLVPATNLPRRIISTLQDKGYTLVLATNPLFPPEGVATRLSWIGLLPTDFCRVTTYNNSTFCKPSLNYYREILRIIDKKPEECRMVGNNPLEDLSARKLGMEVYFVTDYVENEHGLPTKGYPQGSLADVLSWAEELPTV